MSYLVSAKVRYRELMKFGSAPNFLVLGAQKAGTTSLFNYLEKFGANFGSPLRKEVQFFTLTYSRGLTYYQAFFPRSGESLVTGEATPDYLFYRAVPERLIESGYSDLKFVILLRDPVDRAFSHYNFLTKTDRTKGFDSRTFFKAIKDEENLVNPALNKFSYSNKMYSYKSRGLYFEQISHWLKYFDRNRFLFLESEEFKKEPRKSMNTVFDFLEIEKNTDYDNAQFKRYNENQYEPIPRDAAQYLSSYFAAPNKKLFELLGRSFDWK